MSRLDEGPRYSRYESHPGKTEQSIHFFFGRCLQLTRWQFLKGDVMNQEETLKLGRDIDALSLEADRLSRQAARLAARCGVKTPDVGGMSERDRETIREALEHRLTTSGSLTNKHEIQDLLRRL